MISGHNGNASNRRGTLSTDALGAPGKGEFAPSRLGGSMGDAQSVSPLAALLAVVRKRQRFIAVWSLAWLAVAVWLIFRLQPYYRAEALVMLDTREVHYAEMRAVLTRPSNVMDVNIARSEVELLSSEGLARRVVEELDLVASPEFALSPPLVVRIADWGSDFLSWATIGLGLPLGGAAEAVRDFGAGFARIVDRDQAFELAVEKYRRRLSVFSDGRSYVIRLSFEARDPAEAARVVNRHAELYVDDQRRMKNEALAGATGWLEREVQELAGRLARAERAEQDYREQNQLFTSRGASLVAQQMTDLNSQLTVAQSDLAQREARLRRLLDLGRRGGGAETDVTGSYNIGRLREQEADALRREADAASQFGDRHPVLLAARSQRVEIQRKINEEIEKIARSVEAEVAIAQTRVANLRSALQSVTGRVAATERAEGRARELQREADATRSLYESLLARQKQVSTQEGIQQADARVVSRAVPPRRPSFPNKTLFLCVAAMVSGSSAVGIALVRERMRSGFGSTEEVEQRLGLPALGTVPLVTGRTSLPSTVVERPRSAVSDSVRNLRHRIALSVRPGTSYTLVITSAVPGEGKTSLALALARSMAGAGLNVLLVDADLRRPAVAPMVWGRSENEGIVSVLLGLRPLDDVARQDPNTPLRILPAESGVVAPQDLFAGAAFRALIKHAEASYDCVVVDTPPVGLLSDAVIVGQLATGALLVVRCERTPASATCAAAQNLAAGGVPILGAVLNAVDIDSGADSATGIKFHYGQNRAYFRN